MCSSVFGPAIVPSLVMWPMRKIGIESRFAADISTPAESRTWPTEPGMELFDAVWTVWIESTITATGPSSPPRRDPLDGRLGEERGCCALVVPRRRARMAICRGDSSPET